MKFKFLQLASCLAFAALSLQAPGQNTAPLPTATTPPGTEEPCGNPAPTDPPPCPDDDTDDDCDKKDSSTYDAAGSSCETNSINSYNGNTHRKVTDLQISGSVGKMPLAFKRFSNTRLSSRNLAQSAFGKESPWSHNFEWIMRDNGGTVAQPIIKVTYPEGKERSFVKSATTNTWVPTIPYKNIDRLISSGDDFVLNTGDLKQVNFKRRIHSVTSGVFYRIESIKDPESNAYTISYNNNDDTLVRQITDPAAHWIKLNYADESIRSATSTKLNQQPITGGTAWSEINVTPGQSFRILAYYMGNDQGNATIPRVAELEFYDENNVKINGTTIGSTPWNGSNELARAVRQTPSYPAAPPSVRGLPKPFCPLQTATA